MRKRIKVILGILFLISAVGMEYAQDTTTFAANLKDKDWHLRMKAAEELGKTKEVGAVEPLIAALSDRSLSVQEKAAWSLGEIGDPKAVEPLVAALKSENPFLRRNIAQALAKIGQPSVKPLITLLKEDWGVRGNAAYALVAMGDLAVPSLIATLGDKKVFVRWYSAWALGEIKDPKAVEPLIAALGDKDGYVRWNAGWALKKITEEDFGEDQEQWQKWWKEKNKLTTENTEDAEN